MVAADAGEPDPAPSSFIWGNSIDPTQVVIEGACAGTTPVRMWGLLLSGLGLSKEIGRSKELSPSVCSATRAWQRMAQGQQVDQRVSHADGHGLSRRTRSPWTAGRQARRRPETPKPVLVPIAAYGALAADALGAGADGIGIPAGWDGAGSTGVGDAARRS